MNIQDTAKTRSAYAIGQPVLRKEDAKLLRGEGRYTDDINLPGQAYAYILRSTVAHGRIKSIDTAAAKAMPGVLAVYTGADLEAYGTLQSALPFKSRDGSDLKKPPRPALPTDKVRFVGDPIACVVARDAAAGQGRRRGDRGRHRAAAGRDHARAGGRAPARPRCSTTCRATSASTSTTATARRSPPPSPRAAHKVKLKLLNTRMIVNTIEPRAAIGSYDKAKERFTLHSCSQGVMGLKAGLVGVMKTTPDKMHVLTGNVGGSFGMKAQVYPEYVCILHAARELGRPVKWTDERSAASSPTTTAATTSRPPSSRSTPRAISSRCGSPATAISAASRARCRRSRRRSTSCATSSASTARR